jgi:hypothetical protein
LDVCLGCINLKTPGKLGGERWQKDRVKKRMERWRERKRNKEGDRSANQR